MEVVLQVVVSHLECQDQAQHDRQEHVIRLIRMLPEVPERAQQVSREQPETPKPLLIYAEVSLQVILSKE